MTIRLLSPSILVIFLYTSIIKLNAQVVEVVDSLKSVSPLSPAKSVKRQDTINLQDFKIDTSLSNLNFSYEGAEGVGGDPSRRSGGGSRYSFSKHRRSWVRSF